MRAILFLHLFILIPFSGFVLSLLIPKKKESIISSVAFTTIAIHAIGFLVFLIGWLISGAIPVNVKDITLYSTTGYEFYLDFCFDKVTATYAATGTILTFLVTIYSRYYMHREDGYKRFFNTILLFYLGYNITIFSGNIETLFIGWEILGICSFLLIAFYRNRYLPVKNALKVFTVYRVGDVGLILAMWASHHLWHENITFFQLNNASSVSEHLSEHSLTGVFISLMILVAAAVKSAQLPFSSWLPRAMEGPTPSSAIFYGSLSVHIGVFLLLRTIPFWENQVSVRVVIGLLGLATAIITSMIARVQASIKAQVAYSSASQIGIIFIELAFGFENLALIHFAGNAFLRTYQLLISPSVVSYLIREQYYTHQSRKQTIEDSWPRRLEHHLYLMSLKEFNLDSFMAKVLWNPMKRAGRRLNFLTLRTLFILFIPTYLAGLISLYTKTEITPTIHHALPPLFSIIGLLMVLKAFSERKNVIMSWFLVMMNHFWIALAVAFNESFTYKEIYWYLSGIVISGLVGYFCLRRIKEVESYTDLYQFHGHVYEYPKISAIFLIACLGLAGFPITPAFIGEDLIFSHIHQDQYVLAISTSLSLIIDGLALIRIFARVFFGPHIKSYHEIPYKSS